MVSEDYVTGHLWERCSCADYARTHVVVNLVVLDAGVRVKHHNAVCVVRDCVSNQPTKPDLNHENAFLTRRQNLVFEDYAVGSFGPTESDVGFVVFAYGVSFDVRLTAFCDENALGKILLYLVLDDAGLCVIFHFDPGLCVLANRQVVVDSSEIVSARDNDAASFVALDCAVLYSGVATQPVLRQAGQTRFIVVFEDAHHDCWLR